MLIVAAALKPDPRGVGTHHTSGLFGEECQFLARTNLPAGGLPTLADGSVDEEALNSPGEIPDVAAGATKSTKLNLAPGRYVMFCNLPGHYQGGMYGTVIVK